MATRPQPRKSQQPNPVRAARTKALAVVGAEVRFFHPAGTVSGTISRVTAAGSVYVQYATVTGPRELRFTQRVDGEYRQSGKGPYWRPLHFEAEGDYYAN